MSTGVGEFLGRIFAHADPDTWIVITGLHNGRAYPRSFQVKYQEAIERHVIRLRDNCERIWFKVGLFDREPNDGGRQADVVGITCVWADIDVGKPDCPETFEAAMALLEPHAPSIIVNSGHGLHAYWLLAEPVGVDADTRERVRGLVAAFQRRLGGDTYRLDPVPDLCRNMGLPGTENRKDVANPKPVEVIEFTGEYYAFDDLVAGLEPVPMGGIPEPGGRIVVARRQVDDDRLREFLNGDPRAADRWNNYAGNEDDLALCNYAINAGWSDEECAYLLKRVREVHGRKPGKENRADYVARTINKAHTRSEIASVNALPGDNIFRPGQPRDHFAFADGRRKRSLRDRLRRDWLTGEEAPPEPDLIPGVLAARNLNIVAAGPKSGKTWLAIDLALAVATGGSWGPQELRAEKGRVLYLAAEDSPAGFRRRFCALANGRGVAPAVVEPDFTAMFKLQEQVLNSKERMAELEAIIRDEQYNLVVLDTLTALAPGLEENNAAAMSAVIASIYRICDTGAGVLLTHHFHKENEGALNQRRQERMRGSSVLAGAYHRAMFVDRKDDDAHAVVFFEGKDGGSPRDSKMRLPAKGVMLFEDDSWRLWEANQPQPNGRHFVPDYVYIPEGYSFSPDELQIINALDRHRGEISTTSKARIMSLVAMREVAFGEALARLEGMGVVRHTPGGPYTLHDITADTSDQREFATEGVGDEWA